MERRARVELKKQYFSVENALLVRKDVSLKKLSMGDYKAVFIIFTSCLIMEIIIFIFEIIDRKISYWQNWLF